jgi:hypothetical protein
MIGFKASDTIQTCNIPFQEEDYVKLFRFIKRKSENGKPKKEKTKKIRIKKEKKVRPDVASPKKRPPVISALLYALRVLWGAVKLILIIFIMFGFIGAGLGTGLVYGYIQTTPELNATDLQITKYNTFIYDVEGNVLAELKRNENRVWIDYVEIPKNLMNAFIAVEDKRFWEHKGVDFRRFLKSAYVSARTKLTGEGQIEGGSTITQQMVKNLTGKKDLTPKRKIQEVWQALKLEREGHCHQVPGNLINGIQFHPFLPLCIICSYFGIEALINLIKGDTPVCLNHKLFLEPQLFLKVLYLRQKVNNGASYLFNGLHLGQVGIYFHFIVGVQVVQVHYLGFYVKIQFPVQETAQIFVNKIIEGVLGNIGFQVLFQNCAGLIFICWSRHVYGPDKAL